MTDDTKADGPPRGFAHRHLPWVVGAAMFVVYLITLNRWPVFSSLPTLAKVVGWDWRPAYYAPIHFLLTWPVRWLPETWQLVGLNLLGAICATLSLVLLARSVSLLPQDRTRDQRNLERSDYSLLSGRMAWLPPVFAVLVCGLQFTFWESAVLASMEALDLLFFSYAIRCLLEYRIDERDAWLWKAAVVLGVGMTNNVAIVGFLPAFFIAVAWIKGLGALHRRFLTRFLGCLLLGAMFYLFLPIINMASDVSDRSFWEILKTQLGSQRKILLETPRYIVLLIGLTSVFPVLFMGIRWPAQFGDISAAGNALTNLMTHVIHLVFLSACLYVAFDPPFSPRRLAGGQFAFLPFYYLGALTIGYCAGYVLLVFGAAPGPKTWQRPTPLRRALNLLLVAAVGAAAVAVPVGLVVQNYSQLRANQTRELSYLADAAARQLPESPSLILSDDSYRLFAVRAAAGQAGLARNHAFIDTSSLNYSTYHNWLRKRHPEIWGGAPERPPGEAVDASLNVETLRTRAEGREAFYVHPSFGYFFEYFYLKPERALFRLLSYPTNTVSAPVLSSTEMEDNDQFWRAFKDKQLGHLATATALEYGAAKRRLRDPNFLILYTGAMFSRLLNYLGVEFQRAGDTARAGDYFKLALEFNTNNPAAFVNAEFNRTLREGRSDFGEPSEGTRERLTPYQGNWDRILADNGPMDEPATSLLLGQAMARSGNFRQAARLLERAVSFVPKDFVFRLTLAQMYVQSRFPDRALEILRQLRAEAGATMRMEDEVDVAQLEAWAFVGRSELPAAEKVLTHMQEKYPSLGGPYHALMQMYISVSRITNAMAVLEKQLRIQTNNVAALGNLAALKMHTGDLESALPLLDRSLNAQPFNGPARMNRAIALLTLGRLDEAERDYQFAEQNMTRPIAAIYFGLAEIAFQRKQNARALENYEKYLLMAPGHTPEAIYVRDRVKALKSGGA